MSTQKKRGLLFKMLIAILIVVVAAVAVVGATNAATMKVGGDKIVTAEQAKTSDAQCILVLGASVLPDGTPSEMLQHRLDVGIDLYKQGVAPKMIMSGDNGTESYNEVQAMKAYAVKKGVPSEDIFCDHAGFSTYESMYRAQAIFGVERMVVVTQSYHLYRALYTADALGMQVCGVPSDLNTYSGQPYYDFREVFARTKDFFQVMIHAKPTFEGDPISLDQSGDLVE